MCHILQACRRVLLRRHVRMMMVLNIQTLIYPHFDIGLPATGLRIGHWNVNHLTGTKLDQIKLYLSKKDGKAQVDVMFLTETFLKSDVSDSLYDVEGFTLLRKDRTQKHGGGILAYVSTELKVKRRLDLEQSDLEVLWLEVCPFKSNMSLLIAGVYCPPSYSKNDDTKLEKNIEKGYLLNRETILLGDFNVDYMKRGVYSKHNLSKGIRSMNFEQMIKSITRPISSTCLDHVYSNCSQWISEVRVCEIGLSDHLPVFTVRKLHHTKTPNRKSNITYRNMKYFNENDFKSTLNEVNWDIPFIFEDLDDIVYSWEALFNDTVESHAPWRQKRVSRESQAPWMTKEILDLLHKRDNLLKKARKTENNQFLSEYKAMRNKAVNKIRMAKQKFYKTLFENDKGNVKGIWNTIKRVAGARLLKV